MTELLLLGVQQGCLVGLLSLSQYIVGRRVSVYQREQNELQCNRWQSAHFRSQARQSQNMSSTSAVIKKKDRLILLQVYWELCGFIFFENWGKKERKRKTKRRHRMRRR